MFKRIWNLISGMFSSMVSGLEERNPQAMLEAEKNNINQQLVNFNAGLVNQAAMIEGQNRQIAELEKRIKQLTNQVNHYAKSGDTATAGRFALQLKTAKEQIAQLIESRAAANAKFVELEKSRDRAFQSVREKMSKLQQMVNETEMINARTELESSAKNMINTTVSTFENLGRIEGRISEAHDRALGRARVEAGRDVTGGLGAIDTQDEAQSQLEASALQEFLSVNGVHTNDSGPVVENKNFGPEGSPEVLAKN